jgi:hypothetical protein
MATGFIFSTGSRRRGPESHAVLNAIVQNPPTTSAASDLRSTGQ